MNLAGAETGLIGLDVVTASYTKGLEHGERARQLSNPPAPKVLDTLARLYRARGVLRARAGDLKGSSDNYRGALAIHEELERRSADPELAFSAAESRARLALALYIEGRQQESRAEYRAALGSLEKLAMEHPENRRYLRTLQSQYLTYGGVLSNRMLAMYDRAEGAELFRKALAIAARLAGDAADRNAQRDLALAHCQYGFALESTEPKLAVAETETGMSMLRRLIARAPEDRGLQQNLLGYLPSYAALLARSASRERWPPHRRRSRWPTCWLKAIPQRCRPAGGG